MNRSIRRLLLASACFTIGSVAGASSPSRAEQQTEHAGHQTAATVENFGEVNFPISCSATAQQQFNRAVAILHSFFYEEAQKAFKALADNEPGCAMAYWGEAMSDWYQLWYPPTEAALKTGSAAVAKAREVGGKTDRERVYIEAAGAFYDGWDKSDHRTRSLAYARAMERIYIQYPNDHEAAIFYALALDATAPPSDKTYANQKKAGAILEPLITAEPNHPGVAHYIIHSYDYPELAERALPAARRYAEIAPSAAHALHMPSHIFTRLGMWQESIASNRAAAEAGQAFAVKTWGPGVLWDQSLHAMDYLEYAYLQTAQDRKAKQVVDDLGKYQKTMPGQMAASYALAAIPARYAVERRDWAGAASLWLPSVAVDWNRSLWTAAMITYAQALGAAHTGQVELAKTETAILQATRDALVQSKNGFWADAVEVERQAAAAAVAHAEHKDDEALALMRSAADLEGSRDKTNVTPGAIAPARELLADMLLELGQPAAALAEYERTLTTERNRYRSIAGAARAAQQAGDAVKARSYYQQLVQLCAAGESDRPELAAAKQYLASD
jgi:hypothetical protein